MKKALFFPLLLAFSFSLLAKPITIEDSELLELRRNFEEIEKVNLDLRNDLIKIQAENRVASMSLELYQAKVDSEMKSQFWKGIAIGGGIAVTIAGLGVLSYFLLK